MPAWLPPGSLERSAGLHPPPCAAQHPPTFRPPRAPSIRLPDLDPAFRGPLSGAHGQRDEAAATYYGYTLDFTPKGRGLYRLFAVPDGNPKGRLLATLTADPAFIHRQGLL